MGKVCKKCLSEVAPVIAKFVVISILSWGGLLFKSYEFLGGQIGYIKERAAILYWP